MRRLPAHLIRNNDLFCNFDMKKLTGKGNIKRTYKCADKLSLAKQIFLRYLYILFADFCEGGKVFLFPSKRYMELRMRRIPKENLIKARKAGSLKDIDLIATQQLAWEPVLTYRVNKRMIDKVECPVVLSKEFRDLMNWKMNTGYKYC